MVSMLLFFTVLLFLYFFFFNATPSTEIYTLSLHDALPILSNGFIALLCLRLWGNQGASFVRKSRCSVARMARIKVQRKKRSEEHTSELQSPDHLVCRLLLEKKKKKIDKQKKKVQYETDRKE